MEFDGRLFGTSLECVQVFCSFLPGNSYRVKQAVNNDEHCVSSIALIWRNNRKENSSIIFRLQSKFSLNISDKFESK